MSPTIRTTWSGHCPWRTAASTPMGMPRNTPSTVAMVASSIVAGKNLMRSSSTGRAVMIDVPRSPRTSCPR